MEQIKDKETHGDCPCRNAILALGKAYYSKEDGSFRQRIDAAFEHMQPLPPEYRLNKRYFP